MIHIDIDISLLLSSPASTLFPYTTLFRSIGTGGEVEQEDVLQDDGVLLHPEHLGHVRDAAGPVTQPGQLDDDVEDRKRTRLNSSHTVVSYAVFCSTRRRRACCSPTRSPLH